MNVPKQQVEVRIETDWYKPGKKLTQFHESEAATRGIVGGRGSGKTTSVAMEAIRHCLHNPGAKVLGLRKTEISQADTTLDTFRQCYHNMGDLFVETPLSLFRSWRGGLTVRIPSLEAIRRYNIFFAGSPSKQEIEAFLDPDKGEISRWCSWIEFRGVPDAAKSQGKLRGYECSMAIMIEADLMTFQDYELLVPCIRWKNAYGKVIEDGGIIIDTNPPSPHHWIAKLEFDNEKNLDVRFWHIPTEENQHNMQDGYTEKLKNLYKFNPSMYKRMVLGEYAEAFDGSPVFYAFSEADHAYEDLGFPKGAYLVRGWDFGVTQAVTWSAYWSYEGEEYWWVLRDYFQTDTDTDRQCKEVLKITAVDFPFWNDRNVCAGVLDFCDPAGSARKSTGGSDLDILSTYNIHPGYKTKNRTLMKTIAICNRLLERRDKYGQPVFRIDKKNSPKLYSAMLGGYRYPKEGEVGFRLSNIEPIKGPAGGNYDHVSDAVRYPIINCMRLDKVDTEEPRAVVGALARPISINPPRRPDY